MSTTTGPEKKKPVRRVRVIEVLDDGELDEATIEAALAEADAAEEAEAEEVEEAEEVAEVEHEKKAEPAKTRVRMPPRGNTTVISLSAAVLVLALLSGFALFKWQSAASAADERRELIALVTEFGDNVANMPYNDLQGANKKVMTYLTGDALEEREKVDLKPLQDRLVPSKASLSSKTYAVYAAELNGDFARAVLVFDIIATAEGKEGAPQRVEKNHLALSLVKMDGTWKISKMIPAGNELDASTVVPGLGDSPAPTTAPSASTAPKK